MPDFKMRLQKYIAMCGQYSRRGAEQLIKEGKVKVDGRRAEIGEVVDPRYCKVTVKGKPVRLAEELVYIMLNKPRGYVSSASDERGRKIAVDLVKCDTRVFSIGRLDMNSEGLLLFTNDGELANKISHPSSMVSKTYHVTVAGEVSDEQLERLSNGSIRLDGRRVKPCDVFVIERRADRTVLGFVITEGRYRQVRRMCEAVRLNVLRLKRTEIAGVKLGGLKLGDWRYLNEKEMRRLVAASKSGTETEENE